ncbi:hypothetical protein [Wenyingzhuangia sp. IMCC45574]
MISKKTILFSIFILIVNQSFSQKYMEKIAKKSCECIEKIPAGATNEEATTSLGLCMIESAGPYQKQLKKDFDIDLFEDDGAEKLGTQIALKMAGTCPTLLMKMVDMVGDDEKEEEENIKTEAAVAAEEVSGTITKVENGQFVVFSLRADNSRQDKFYWLTFVKSNIDIMSDYETLVGKKVTVFYKTEDFFDARINDYRNIKVITEISVQK